MGAKVWSTAAVVIAAAAAAGAGIVTWEGRVWDEHGIVSIQNKFNHF